MTVYSNECRKSNQFNLSSNRISFRLISRSVRRCQMKILNLLSAIRSTLNHDTGVVGMTVYLLGLSFVLALLSASYLLYLLSDFDPFQ
jgi:hypothetical protein